MKSVSHVLLGSSVFWMVAAGFFFVLPSLPWSATVALLIFLTAIWAWTFTKLDPTLVAVAASLAMWSAGLLGDRTVLSGLGDPFVAFVVAGFMLGGAYKVTGLSERVATWFARRSHRVERLFYLLTVALVLLSLVVPSTSARAALLMPVYLAVTHSVESAEVRKGLAVLFPTVIVLSCVTSYLGAGANLMTADFIAHFAGQRISYLQWLALGAPLGLASCLLSTWVILRVFLTPAARKLDFRLTPERTHTPHPEQSASQRRVLLVTAVLVACWMTEPLHGLDAGVVALAGALVFCLPVVGVFSFKQALKEVEWHLVVFMAATLELSQGLVQSGLVEYVIQQFAASTGGGSEALVLSLILTVALLSHLLINSRTARAAVLMPVLIPLGISAGQPGLLVAFFANAAMGYCLTLPVCAKPVAMFSTAGGEGYTTHDLLRLSAWLLPLHLLLFGGAYWLYKWLLEGF
jgi:anion transporter